MYLKQRQLKLLAMLENENEFIPMRQFSNKLNVSVRTIYYDIESINKIITRNGKRIKKKSGVGVKLVRENEVKHQKDIIYLINQREKRLINT